MCIFVLIIKNGLKKDKLCSISGVVHTPFLMDSRKADLIMQYLEHNSLHPIYEF